MDRQTLRICRVGVDSRRANVADPRRDGTLARDVGIRVQAAATPGEVMPISTGDAAAPWTPGAGR